MHYFIFAIIGLLFNIGYLENSEIKEVETADVIVHVTSIDNIKGEVLVGIYDSKRTWRKVKKVLQYKIKSVDADTETVVLEDIPSGTYAIAIFQDFNGNKKFDSNWLGVPKEPFGFSNNFMVDSRAPKYKEVTFSHSAASNTEMEIIMQEW